MHIQHIDIFWFIETKTGENLNVFLLLGVRFKSREEMRTLIKDYDSKSLYLLRI